MASFTARLRRTGFALVIALGLVLAGAVSPSVASAETVSYLTGSPKVSLTKQEDGSSKGKVVLTNLTPLAAAFRIAVAGGNEPGCEIVYSPGETKPATSTTVELAIPASCPISTAGRPLEISINAGAQTGAQTLPVLAEYSPNGPFNLDLLLLWLLPFSVVTFVILLFTGVAWHRKSPPVPKDGSAAAGAAYGQVSSGRVGIIGAHFDQPDCGFAKPRRTSRLLDTIKGFATRPLPGLDKTWTFKESWASNATLITAVFSGIFGASEVFKALTGLVSVPSSFSYITVGSAVAAALVGFAPVTFLLLRNNEGQNTVVGLLTACWVALSAAMFQVAVIAYIASTFLDSGVILVLGVVVVFLLALYAWRSTFFSLVQGARDPAGTAPTVATGAEQSAPAKREQQTVPEVVTPRWLPDGGYPPPLFGVTSRGDSPAAMP